MNVLRASLSRQSERDGRRPRDLRPIRRPGRREPERPDDLVELAGVVAVVDGRLDLVALDLPVDSHPERHGERGPAQFLRRRVEREGKVAELGWPDAPSLATPTGARAGTRPLAGSDSRPHSA